MKVDIKVAIKMPKKVNDNYKQKSLHNKVCDYILVCESDEDSESHWRYLKYLHKKLKQYKRLPPDYFEIMAMLEDFLSKHGQYDSGDGQADIEGKDMFKYRGEA